MSDDLERGLIGSLINNCNLLINTDLQPLHFSNGHLATIYETMHSMSSSGKLPFDAITLADEIEKIQTGDWLQMLWGIAKETINRADSELVKKYCTLIKQRFNQHQVKVISAQLQTSIDAQGNIAISNAITKLMALLISENKTSYTIKESLKAAADEIEQISNGQLPGIPTGFEKLDAAIGGLKLGELIFVCGRPAMGKTAFLTNIAENCGVACGIISSEMSHKQCATRMLISQGRADSGKIRAGKIDDDQWGKISAGIALVSEMPIFIDDKAMPTILQIQQTIRKWHHENGIKIVLVDYLQRIVANNTKLPKHLQVEEVAQGLVVLAKELDIAVICLAQVKREVGTRPNKRPGMSDIKDSGSAEQEAHQVWTLYRDEYYNDTTVDNDGVCELTICKNRNGQEGTIYLNWEKTCMRFSNQQQYQKG